jgi:lysophospholipase L1-like esterase
VVGLLVSAGLLAAVEGTFRLAGWAPPGSEPSPLLAQEIDFSPVQPGPEPGTLTFMPMGPHNPSTRWTTTTTVAPAGLRIVTFGGSTTYGLPFTPFESFSGLLQRALVALGTGRPVEVVNAGVCSMGSAGVLQVVRAVLRSGSPDLLVVYSGNNEYLDRAAIALAARETPPLGRWIRGPLGRLHLFRWLDIQLRPRHAPPPVGPHPTMGEVLRRPISPEERQIVQERYRRNLTALAKAAREAGVPVLLSTVPTNLRDVCQACGDGQVGEVEEKALAAIEGAAAAGDAGAVKRLARGAEALAQDEEGQVRLARAFLAVEDTVAARRHFEQAEQLSRFAIRGDDLLREVVREVARAEGTALCDAAHAFDTAAEWGIPGRDLFDDPCHPNLRGHLLLARTMLDCILAEDLLGLDAREPAQVAAAAASLEEPNAVDCPWRLDRSGTTARAPATDSVRLLPCDLALHGHRAFMAQDLAGARGFYRAARQAGGAAGWLLLDEGLVARLDGDLSGARASFAQAAAIIPDDPDLLNFLAITGGDAAAPEAGSAAGSTSP